MCLTAALGFLTKYVEVVHERRCPGTKHQASENSHGWPVQQYNTSLHTLQLLAHAAENITVKVNVKEVGVELDVRSAVVRRRLRKGIGYHVRHWRRVRVAWP